MQKNLKAAIINIFISTMDHMTSCMFPHNDEPDYSSSLGSFVVLFRSLLWFTDPQLFWQTLADLIVLFVELLLVYNPTKTYLWLPAQYQTRQTKVATSW